MAPSKDDEFDWETYMGDKAYTPASQEAFYQNPEIPENRFKVGKKVAIQDPRVPDSKCLGHIITVDKIWICVSLSGEKFAEYWLNCDDETLWPLSEVIKEGPLQPPKNFEGNPEKYMDYVDQQLQYDEDTEEDPRAPPEWFNRISPKLKPKENLFKPGMKLEVPDLKRFKAELYPAAVRSVNGNIVNVGFDGWGKKFDMTDTNECRFFYPVGTAKKIGVRLVPPPGYGAKATPKPKATPKTKTPKTVTEKKLNGNSAAATPASSKSTPINKTIPAKTPRKSAVGTSPKKSTAPLKPAGRRTDLKRNNSASSSEPDEKKPKLEDIKTASTKKYVPSLADALAKTTPSSAKKTPKSPAKKRKPISSVADDHHANSHSEIVLLPAKDIKPSDLTFQFFVNPTCYRTDLLNREKLPRLHPKFGAGNVHHIMREFLQQVVDVSSKPQEIIKAIPIKSPNILGVYAVIDGLEHAKFLPVARNIDHAWNIMNELFDKLKFCSNFITRTPKSCSHCPFLNRGQSNQKSKPSSAVTPIKQDSEASSSISSPIPALPKSIKQWNVNQLCSQITKLVPYSVVHTFREHEIDGKAAVLLDEDTLITMLRIPPNYAAKLMEFIDSKSDEV